jgi:curved DNA-binding protein CbpA
VNSSSPHVCRPEDIPLEAVPIVCEGIAFLDLALDAREGFMLSRLDGRTSVKHLFSLTGLGQDETLKLLAELHAKGVVTWHQARSREKPAAAARPVKKPASAERPLSEKEFAALVEELFLSREHLNWYELLGVDSNAASKAVKKAYLQQSKLFHPDRHFRHADPEFRRKLQEIFKRINLAYRELSDPVRRGEYDVQLRQEDAAKPRLDLEWDETVEVRRKDRPRPAEPPPAEPPPPGPKLKLDFGKGSLERRLEEKLKEARSSAEVQSLLAQARRFYQGALVEIEKRNLKAAEINLKLALHYDPQNPTYLAETERLKQLESTMQAEIAFKQGQEAEEMQDYSKAIRLYGEALKINPENPQGLYRLAKVVLEQQHNYERARVLVLKAIDLKKGNADFHFLLGQAYQGLGQKQPAIIQMEKALELNPKHKQAAKELRALRKK